MESGQYFCMTLSREVSFGEPVETMLSGNFTMIVLEPENDWLNLSEVDISTNSSFFCEQAVRSVADTIRARTTDIIFFNNFITSNFFNSTVYF